ncbi:hypothetical protein [Bacillus sp. 2205SS5-2]|uniref:hypothetical protein n=1 Tax=Bacillus sp. 2205SS5-2 TaxID=3109031 RepID=UPI0030059A2E
MKLRSLFLMDVKFQFRHGFYYAYGLVTIFYLTFLFLLPLPSEKMFAILIIFTDPSLLGFFFIGGTLLLEKGQGILNSIFISTVSVHHYLWSKLLSLTLLAYVSSILIFSMISPTTSHFFLFQSE